MADITDFSKIHASRAIAVENYSDRCISVANRFPVAHQQSLKGADRILIASTLQKIWASRCSHNTAGNLTLIFKGHGDDSAKSHGKHHPSADTPCRRFQAKDGGAEGSRTPDLLIANETLYQLSYDPNQSVNTTPKSHHAAR
jgi:hypothetical protein